MKAKQPYFNLLGKLQRTTCWRKGLDGMVYRKIV